ncbi:MAG: nucleic acid binding OB-fold tRNA/helicase-type, partial [Firmicutes bacterium]|nr:nucleic acid binding OB-fold tRNA/helicase-type [Bacillota bacterium]
MKRFAKRCLAVILSIIMVFSINPVQANAAATASTYVKVTDQTQLTDGKYVMVVNSGYAMGALDQTIWYLGTKAAVTSAPPIESQVLITDSDASFVWDIDVVAVTATGSAITLTDANGVKIKPKGLNNNGISNDTGSGYQWDCTYNAGTFTFKGTGSDTVTLASTTVDASNPNKFRAFKNTTATPTSTTYLSAFTLYKLDSSAPSGPVKAAVPTANPPSGTVASGSAITLTSATPGSNIQYRVNAASASAIWMDYSGPITISSNSIIEAKAKSLDSLESDTATFTYTLAKEEVSDPSLVDPIASIPSGSLSVLEATQAATGQAISVVGQLVYKFGNYDSANSSILQDVIDGKVYAIQIYDALSDYKIGDIVKLTGTTSVFGGVPQVEKLTAKELIAPASATPLIAAQEFTSINEMKAYKASLLSEWVV